MNAALILPNQLYYPHPQIGDGPIFLVEEDAYFTRYRFHKQKLVLHRASMKAFKEILSGECNYIENNPGKTLDVLFNELISRGVKTLSIT
ncbi:MAG: cryptochrome/photolyase family protein, partial [Melioribacteraceae bacterium]|nr:cryptochrome/photolyase family protein [Melioribacteraceae bacterium]